MLRRSISFYIMYRHDMPRLRRPYLFPLAGKDMEEKGAGIRNGADAQKSVTICLPFIVATSVKERPSGGANNFCVGNIVAR